MSKDNITIEFNGEMADEHRLPAYEAAQTLVGITRAMLIPATYLAEGRVRHRGFDSRKFSFNLLATKKGSFQVLCDFSIDPASLAVLAGMGQELTKSVATEFVKDFVTHIIYRAIGKKPKGNIEKLSADGEVASGDMDALVDAIEPSMREAHLTIGNGAKNIIIVNGSHNVIKLDGATKAFVNEAIVDKEIREKDLSIASYNANSGNGRAFDYEEGRTIAFTIDRDADARSLAAILESLRIYANAKHVGDRGISRISVKYTAILALDGRVKKMKILHARRD